MLKLPREVYMDNGSVSNVRRSIMNSWKKPVWPWECSVVVVRSLVGNLLT